jgi:hypothetical protein
MRFPVLAILAAPSLFLGHVAGHECSAMQVRVCPTLWGPGNITLSNVTHVHSHSLLCSCVSVLSFQLVLQTDRLQTVSLPMKRMLALMDWYEKTSSELCNADKVFFRTQEDWYTQVWTRRIAVLKRPHACFLAVLDRWYVLELIFESPVVNPSLAFALIVLFIFSFPDTILPQSVSMYTPTFSHFLRHSFCRPLLFIFM